MREKGEEAGRAWRPLQLPLTGQHLLRDAEERGEGRGQEWSEATRRPLTLCLPPTPGSSGPLHDVTC